MKKRRKIRDTRGWRLNSWPAEHEAEKICDWRQICVHLAVRCKTEPEPDETQLAKRLRKFVDKNKLCCAPPKKKLHSCFAPALKGLPLVLHYVAR